MAWVPTPYIPYLGMEGPSDVVAKRMTPRIASNQPIRTEPR